MSAWANIIFGNEPMEAIVTDREAFRWSRRSRKKKIRGWKRILRRRAKEMASNE